MYVRLGLAIARVNTFLKNPRFNTNWEIKEPNQLKKWYDLLMGHIRTNQYGVYFAAQEVFGAHAVEFMAKKGRMKKPECLVPAPLQAGSSRPNVEDDN